MRIVCGLLLAWTVLAQTPSAEDREAALDGIRTYARSYTQSLPDYIATQTIRRDVTPVVRGILLPSVRPQTDMIEEEVGYVGHREMHKTIRVNGLAVSKPQPDDGGLFSQGEFGALLDTIFNPANGATFRWNRTATFDKRRVYVVDFRVPDRPAGYSIMEGSTPTVVSFRGSVYADEQSKAVLRIEMTCTGIPSSSAYRQLELAIDYAPTQVAGNTFVLPTHYTLNATRVDANLMIDGRCKDYRRFATDSKILLDEENR
jgi:hypothetical protein